MKANDDVIIAYSNGTVLDGYFSEQGIIQLDTQNDLVNVKSFNNDKNTIMIKLSRDIKTPDDKHDIDMRLLLFGQFF